MFPNNWLNRLVLRIGILLLSSITPCCFLYILLTLLTHPAPPVIALLAHLPIPDSLTLLDQLDKPSQILLLYTVAEATWWFVNRGAQAGLNSRWWDFEGEKVEMSSEERWRLWKSMVESAADPWEAWLGRFFLPPGHKRAPRGADDPLFSKVKLDQVGRTNVEEWIAHTLFSAPLRSVKTPNSLSTAELHSMIVLLEAQITLSRGPKASHPFKFLRGRSPHTVFQLSEEPLNFAHHPLIFYAAIRKASWAADCALYAAGFRYYGPRRSLFFPWRFKHRRHSLESLLEPLEAEKMGDARLADRVGYWMKPATKARAEEDARPVVFCHGISGLFVAVPFAIALSWLSGRALFLPTLPYLSMRLAPPSAILTRLEYVAAVRRMLWAHGFGLTSVEPNDDDSVLEDEDDEEDWRRAKAVVIGHSAGSAMVGWLCRDASDLIAGLVLIDPMSFLLYSADAPRNFFRTKCKTAGEIFFRYFSLERGISHFLSRHLLWSDSVLFGPHPAAPLPPRVVEAIVPKCARAELDPEDGPPYFAPRVDPVGEGPLPTVVFLSALDCILPFDKIVSYLTSSGFSTGPTPSPSSSSSLALEDSKEETSNGALVSSSNSASSPPASDAAEPNPPSLRIMHGAEHGAILSSLKWIKEVAKAVEDVADAARRWDDEEGEE